MNDGSGRALSRRRLLQAVVGTVGAASVGGAVPSAGAATGTPTDASRDAAGDTGADSDLDEWFGPNETSGATDNYDGTVADATGRAAVTVEVGAEGNGGSFGFSPPAVRVSPGTTVRFEWVSDTHSVAVAGQPCPSEWEGHEDIGDAGTVHEHTVEVPGTYRYFCRPHLTVGMKGAIVVEPAEESPGVDPTGHRHTVELAGSGYEPEVVQIRPGDTVVWKNTGDDVETVTADADGIPDGADYWASGGFDSEGTARSCRADRGYLVSGASYEHTFATEGTHGYYSVFDESMRGVVEVTTDRTTETSQSRSSTSTVELTDDHVYEPAAVQVRTGETVVWKNVGEIGHTVTAYEDGIPDDADYWASGGGDAEADARNGYPDSGLVEGGDSYEHTFETEGTHEYFCIPHESVGMVGTVDVVPATPTGEASPTGSTTGEPASNTTSAPSSTDRRTATPSGTGAPGPGVVGTLVGLAAAAAVAVRRRLPH